jgi:MoaA/NifB/PqqE/SkfB family radical SAM enzyme
MNLDFLRANYLDQPYEVSIETLALCNAACTFCPYPTLDRKGTQLPDMEIDRLLFQMQKWPKPFTISPFKVNEPLLDNRMMHICRAINVYVPQAKLRLFTNGSPLTIEKMHAIDALDNVAHLWVSLNSHDSAEYKRLMSLDFERTTGRLDQLHTLVQTGYFRHQVVISKVSSSQNHLDGDSFLRYCDNRWPMFRTTLIKQDGWLGYVPPVDPAIPNTPCTRWFELSILATGIVSLCCMDGKGEFPIGNIRENSLLEIYNRPLWRDRREHMISRLEIHPCSTCTY